MNKSTKKELYDKIERLEELVSTQDKMYQELFTQLGIKTQRNIEISKNALNTYFIKTVYALEDNIRYGVLRVEDTEIHLFR